MERFVVYGVRLIVNMGFNGPSNRAWEPIARVSGFFFSFPCTQMCKLISLNAHEKQNLTITFSQLLHFAKFPQLVDKLLQEF